MGGDRKTARRLLAAEGLGLAGLVTGFAALGVSGASPHFVSPSILLIVAGAGLFSTSALADLYGVLTPPGGTGAASPSVAAVEARAGTLFVRNPTFPYRWLASTGMDLRLHRWRLAPTLFRTFAGPTLRAEVRAGYRLRGRQTGRSSGPGNTERELHRARRGTGPPPRGSRGSSPSISPPPRSCLSGRTELARLAPSLAGSFLDWGFGLAMGASHYGGPVGTFEATDLLLARFGYGFYLGRGPAPRAEVLLAYDHRHDDFAGGLKIPGLGSGPAGYFGVEATAHLHESWGVRAVAQAGSAHVVGLQLVYRRADSHR